MTIEISSSFSPLYKPFKRSWSGSLFEWFLLVCLVDDVKRHLKQYFSYIGRSVVLVEETGGPGKKPRPVASHWQTLSHNVVPFALIEIRTHNIGGERHWLHRQSYIQLPYDRGHDGPLQWLCETNRYTSIPRRKFSNSRTQGEICLSSRGSGILKENNVVFAS
jgi:hypothetical protein